MEKTETTAAVTPKKRGRRSKAEIEAAKAAEIQVSASQETVSYDQFLNVIKEAISEEPPKKRGRKPKAAVTEIPAAPAGNIPAAPKDALIKNYKGGWSDERRNERSLAKSFMNVEIMLLRDALGMMPNSTEILREYIDSKNPDAPSIADEVMAYGTDSVEDGSTTLWPLGIFYYDEEKELLVDKYDPATPQWIRDLPDSDPRIIRTRYLYDYQLRGLFKDACGLLSRAKNNKSSELRAYKKIIDGNIFVMSRHVGFDIPDKYVDENGVLLSSYDENGQLRRMQRPLRISGPQGERTALASSEVMPAGSSMKFTVGLTSKAFADYVAEWLDYGLVRGIGQWRNSGAGIFKWRLLDENWQPIEE